MLKNKQLSESDISALTIKPSFMIDHTYSKAAVQAVDELIQFIDNNPLNRKSVSMLFPHFYSNRNIIYGAFEAITGRSVKEYRAFKLMEAAANMITEREQTIQQIAYKCGYRGPKAGSNFTRAFRKVIGKSPKQWAKELKRQGS
jgi:AraC-like DNA-binding protein